MSKRILRPTMFKGQIFLEKQNMQDKQMAAAMEMAMSMQGPCIVCGGEPDMCGMWLPNAKGAETLNVPLNKQRIIAYWICRECKKLPNSLVEAILAEQMKQETATEAPEPFPAVRRSQNRSVRVLGDPGRGLNGCNVQR